MVQVSSMAQQPHNQGIAKMLQPFPRRLVLAALMLLAALSADAVMSPARAQAQFSVDGQQSVSRAVKVGLNKSVIIDLPRDARDILVSNPVIADAVIRTPRRIYVTGVAVGQSNVIVFDRAGLQIVSLELEVERDSSNLSRMLARLIPDSDIQIEVVSDNIVLSGTVRNASDARRAEDIATIFANGGAEVQRDKASTSTSASSGVSISLTSSQQTPTSSVINMLAIEGEDQVHLKVTVAEVQRNIAKQLGIEFNGNIQMGGLGADIAMSNPFAIATKSLGNSAGGGWFKDDNNNLFMTIKALEQTGMIRTLAEPTLTAISGETASFLAGGEFPVPTGRDQSGNITIEFKAFGVALGFTPVVLSEGRISLRVKTEVSELSAEGAFSLSGSTDDLTIPGLKVRRAESTLELPSGGSMVLGGLIQDTVRQSIGAFPGLGRLPVLGPLFRSRDFQRNETELVIIVTPVLVKPVPRSALATPDQGFAAASDAQGVLLGNINRVYGVKGSSSAEASYQYTGRFGFIFE
ncbi:MAG: type II and III secretion system protein family protein [Bauldia sp.]